MITSWENECKVRAEPSLLGFCRTAAAFMKLIMAAHTSWHSSEAASGDHWCKSRAETKLVWSLTRRSPMTGVAKTKQGEERHQPFPILTDERTTASLRLVCEKNSASVKGYCKTRLMCLKKVLALIAHRLIEES